MLVENLPVPLDRRTWQEARTLAGDGWDVTIIGPKGAGEMRAARQVIDGIEILRYPQRAASGLAGYFAEYLPSMALTLILLWRTSRRGRRAAWLGVIGFALVLCTLFGTRYLGGYHVFG